MLLWGRKFKFGLGSYKSAPDTVIYHYYEVKSGEN